MTTIVTRSGKGSPLTNAEMDANLNNLNNDKLERDGSIPLTSPLQVPLGSVSAPSVTFTGDTNTGVYSSASDTVDIAANGVKQASFSPNSLALNASGTAVTNVTGLNGGPLSGFRNKIINGDMTIAQRGTSFAAIANATYSLDRWIYTKVGSVVQTVTQSTDVPTFGTSGNFKYSLGIQTTTADVSIAAGDVCAIGQRIEGFNVRDLVGKDITLSFRVKGAKTGTHCVAFRNSGVDKTYVAEYTINSANTWETKSVTITGGLTTDGTWDYTSGVGLNITWALSCGSTFQTTAGSWQTGNFLGTSNQVNETDSVSNNFYITGVQLEIGSVPTEFETRSYSQEFSLCSRYFQWVQCGASIYIAGAGSLGLVPLQFPQMRAVPTGGSIVTDPNVTQSSSNLAAFALNTISINGTMFSVQSVSAGTVSALGYRASLTAEL